LLSVLAATLLTPENDVRADSIDTVRSLFMNHAQRHWAETPNRWYDRREEIWNNLVQIYDRATPAGADLADAAAEFEDFLRTPLDRTRGSDNIGSRNVRYIERMADLCSDIRRVVSATDLVQALKSALAEAPAPPIITYRSTSDSATFGDLYVDRTLVNRVSNTEISGMTLGKQGAPYRAVVHGAPGAGKSTFVKHLRRELAHDPDSQPALLLTLRSYFPAAKNQSIVEHLSEDARASLSVENDPAQLRDVLTLGLITVVFDGLDEITDIHLRIEMVSRIASFAREFPAVSILVTSRSIGYDSAPLPREMFQTYVLNEYTAEQSEEYVRRWFAFINRGDLADDFERESESIRDLRSNPLLLSLLCILYGERGSIPRRRRDIYAQCADLLFHTWDSHRHIHQPEELHANGDRIMQEIAQWVYKSQKAQNGLPESVIKHSIGIYLRDTVGVEDGEARRRAGEFLEFCANRAWLLGATGTERGERMFGFTHRTFFEFFTAEAFSRISGDPEKLAEILVGAHKRDATSVLPELLLQSIDDKFDRGGANTFRKVCEQTEDEMLILRLMEGIGLPLKVRAQGFDRVLELWESRRRISRPAFVALLSLNVDARSQFIREYLVPERPDAVDMFIGGWTSLDASDGLSRHRATWDEVANRLIEEYKPLKSTWYRPEVLSWLWRAGRGRMPDPNTAMHLTAGAWGPCLGTLWYGIEAACSTDPSTFDDDLVSLLQAASLAARSALPRRRAQIMEDLLVERIEAKGVPDANELESDALWAYLYVVAVVSEATDNQSEEVELLQQSLPDVGMRLLALRDAAAEHDGKRPLKVPQELRSLPPWLTEWGQGRRSFVAARAGDD